MLVSGNEAAAEASVNGEDSKLRHRVSSSPITVKFMDVSYRVKLQNTSGATKPRIACNTKNMIFNTSSGESTPASSDVENQNPTDHHHHHHHHDLQRHQQRTILNNITGMATPGQILAVLGPSGSGKSTLLNAVAGRLHHGHGLTGTVLFNNRKPTKTILKKTGFVAQDDVLYPHLTVRETLIFCALLGLPNSMSREDKVAVADRVISEMGLSKCEHTIIGNTLVRGISGGERKRVSIAHEMLVDPSVLILDEPTSGLDATAAYRVVAALGNLVAKGKTVVTSLHQPSSRVYQMFDDLLLLSEGRCIYFGKRSEAMDYFENVGFSPSFAVNPADFMLDLANGVCHYDGTSEKEQPNVRQALVSSYNNLLAPRVKTACMDTPCPATRDSSASLRHHTTTTTIKPRHHTTLSNAQLTTTWLNQFTILLQRNLKERKYETFNSLRVFHVIISSLLAGFMWWHSDYRDIQDRLSLLFFISIFWGVFSSFNAVFTFPQERAVFTKERASGMYTLSSYFMARITSDLPMELVLPTLFLCMVYWMTGLKPELYSFSLTLVILLGYVLVSQGLGLALGALIMDSKQASTMVTVIMLAFVLTGGYYVHKVPSFMSWIKYVSTTFYSYRLLISVQYGDGKNISSLLGCGELHHKAVCKFIDEDVCGQLNPWTSASVLMLMFVGYRLLAYIALRRIRV